MTAAEVLPWIMGAFTAIAGWRVFNEQRDKQHQREQNVDGEKSIKSRVKDLEDRMDDATGTWSAKHNETIKLVGTLQLDLRDVQGQGKRNADDIQKLWDRRH